jgi:hypothetical protein
MEVGARSGAHFQLVRQRNHKIEMKTKQLGSSDLFITPVGLGACLIRERTTDENKKDNG